MTPTPCSLSLFPITPAEEKGFTFAGKSVALLGAGGAGRACAVAAALEGASRIVISDLQAEKAFFLAGLINERIREDLAQAADLDSEEWKTALGEAELVVDATPLGMKKGDPPGFDPRLLGPRALVMDLVYNPPETPLLAEVRRGGGEGMNGLGMLVHQAARAWEITGRSA